VPDYGSGGWGFESLRVRVKDEKEEKNQPVMYSVEAHENTGINIYDHGRIEGVKFILNKPIPLPGGGVAEVIDFSGVMTAIEGEDGLLTLEAAIAAFLAPGLDERSKPVSLEEEKRVRGQQYN
jgi:hypothetical protein